MTLPEWVCAPDREPQSQDTFAAGFAVAGEDQEKAADAGRRSGSGNSDKSEQDNHKETYPEKIANAKNRLDEAQIELENARPENEATGSRVKETQQALSVVEREFKLYRSKHRFRFLFDLLSESFDEDHPVVALHRFQMITWTLIWEWFSYLMSSLHLG